jgi:hypothetical protein
MSPAFYKADFTPENGVLSHFSRLFFPELQHFLTVSPQNQPAMDVSRR